MSPPRNIFRSVAGWAPEAGPGQTPLTRRAFLRAVAAMAAASLVPGVAGCGPLRQRPPVQAEPTPMPLEAQYPEVPVAPSTPPSPDRLVFFTPEEAATVEALTARILPGTPDDPGAREAGVVTYIDHLLSHENGFPEKTYLSPPFAEIYPLPPGAQAPSDDVVWVAADQVQRYGYQSRLTNRDVYRIGLPAVNAYAEEVYGAPFASLSEEQQDAVIEDMVNGDATGFEPISSLAFFHTLRKHTSEGMFSDPAYGGNRGFAGWRLIGFPGAQRYYLPEEVTTEGTTRAFQGLHDL
ncbi:MAG: gluconate 2-dehydrogenase subunit 3 family protein, partial [Anaerolineae bacterium]